MDVRELMTHDVRTSAFADSLNRVVQLMRENDCRCIPVVLPEGRAIDVLTDLDVCMVAYKQRQALAKLLVSSAMSRDIVSVGEAESVDFAEALMQERHVGRLPAVDAIGRAIGIVSLNDLIVRARRISEGLNRWPEHRGRRQKLPEPSVSPLMSNLGPRLSVSGPCGVIGR